jgi:hypothetical protein
MPVRPLNHEELLILKAVSTEEFPESGWVGLVVPCSVNQQRVIGVYTRADLYARVNRLFDQLGAEHVREQAKRKLPRRFDLHFVAARDAGDKIDAGRIMNDAITRRI